MLRADYQRAMRKDILRAAEFLSNGEALDHQTYICRMATLKRTIDIAYADLIACNHCAKLKYGERGFNNAK